ncbi:hypothetical protein GCM10012275_06180 [Longimycelium tulufanense]|uniref:Cell division protein FtsL n=1 Tax=Longimycelium tulufanense TaxID=907463 RepID=A0A8J3CAK9_9PSEU|nr:hypothetical protein [Longimycelium tulufanense]GGM37908.1 hypothetical protein GCM10012275_06180 [Longimycelium tulufanense]
MTAPARVPDPAPPSRGGGGGQRTAERTERRGNATRRSTAAERAYARRAQFRRRWLRVVPHRGVDGVPRAPFVLLVMGLLAVGLLASLWLSTAAGANSYKLEEIQTGVRDLGERAEQLRREVAQLESPSEIARRAKERGMVPAPDPAHIVVRPDGSIEVVGTPKPAAPPPPPPAPQPPPADRPPAGPPAEQPGAAQPPQEQPGQPAQPPAEGPQQEPPPAQDGPQQPPGDG